MNDTSKLPKDFFKQFNSRDSFQSFFNDLFKQGIEEMLKAELDEHLGYEKHSKEGYGTGNSRNGSYPKTIKTDNLGDVILNIPRDRKGDFEPQIIPKGHTISETLENAITGMYSRGMTTGDITDQVKEFYGVNVSEGTISNITNRMLGVINEWQNRPLESVYFTVWMDGIVIKVKQNGKYINKCIFIVIGLKNDGIKEVLGLWISETESASFWMTVLTDLKARGVKDILIACTDNLAGFTQAIVAVFPLTVTQLCVVHQIRNSCKFVVYKDRRDFCSDLKNIYNAINLEQAEKALVAMDLKWGTKYKYAIKSWQENWLNLIPFFDYPLEMRKLIYTTNTIENLNRGIRKYTKTKVQFVDDNAVKKAVYLAIMNIEKKWNKPISGWGLILHQFLTIFEKRCKLN